MLLLGITFSGLFPLVKMYSRMVGSLEHGPDQVSSQFEISNAYRVTKSEPNTAPLDAEWYHVPATDEWVRKRFLVPFSDSDANLAVDAQLSAADAWARRLGIVASVRYKRPADRVSPPDCCTSPESLPEPTQQSITPLDAVVGPQYSDFPVSPDPAWSDDSPAAASAYGGNQRHPPVSVATALWTFTGVTAGWYQVEATGLAPGGATLPANTYSLSYVSHAIPMVEDVTPATAFTFQASSDWQFLAVKYFDAGNVTVQLTTDASGTAIADGMRLVRCSLQITSWPPPTATTATATVEIRPAVRP